MALFTKVQSLSRTELCGFNKVCRHAIDQAHFNRMQDPPNVKKWLAYESEVNEGFAKTA